MVARHGEEDVEESKQVVGCEDAWIHTYHIRWSAPPSYYVICRDLLRKGVGGWGVTLSHFPLAAFPFFFLIPSLLPLFFSFFSFVFFFLKISSKGQGPFWNIMEEEQESVAFSSFFSNYYLYWEDLVVC